MVADACKTIDRKLRHSETSLFELIAAKADLALVDRYVDACLAAGPVFVRIYDEERETMRGIQDRLDEAQSKVEYKQREMEAKEASLLKELNRTIDEGRERMYSTIATKDATIAGIQNHANSVETALRQQISALEQQASSANARLHAITSSPAFRIANKIRRMLSGGETPAPATPHDAAPLAPAVAPELSAPAWQSKSLSTKFAALEELERFANSAETTAQSRLGHKLLPPGSGQEKLVQRFMKVRQVQREHGTKVLIGRALGKPLPPHALPAPFVSPAERFEITRQEILKVERATHIAEQYEQSVKVMVERAIAMDRITFRSIRICKLRSIESSSSSLSI